MAPAQALDNPVGKTPLVVGSKLGIKTSSRLRVWILRSLALSIAAYGIHSLRAVNISSKLSMQVPTGFADFQISTPAFLLHHLGVVGLGICVVHCALKVNQAVGGRPLERKLRRIDTV